MNPQKNEENRTEKNRMITGTIVTIAGGILWGVSGVCGQYMFQNKGVTAPWLVSVRLVAAGLLMLCYYFLTDREQTLAIWKSKRDRRDVLIYGLLGMMPCQYAYFQTIEWSNAGPFSVSPCKITAVHILPDFISQNSPDKNRFRLFSFRKLPCRYNSGK